MIRTHIGYIKDYGVELKLKSRSDNLCLQVVSITVFYSIHQLKHDTNNKWARNNKFKHDPLNNQVTQYNTCNPFINFVI